MVKSRITTAGELLEAGLIRREELAAVAELNDRYAIAITRSMGDLIESPDDPIARQFVPDPREAETKHWELADPIGDRAHAPVKGLVHRYPDRVLLKLTAVCQVYCRFCFRREMIGPNSAEVLTPQDLEAACQYIEAAKGVWEVVISGGDPLALSPRRIAAITDRLSRIEHLSIIRWHTRVPVVSPETVTPTLIEALSSPSKTVYLAVHTNHVREHTPAAAQACLAMRKSGIVLVGQSVLLKGVNDDAETLEALMRSCVKLGIKPYYLHLLDRAPGTSHFKVPLHRAVELVSKLRGRLSGLCQPTLILDIPGGHGKVPLPVSGVTQTGDSTYEVEDYNGNRHTYADEL